MESLQKYFNCQFASKNYHYNKISCNIRMSILERILFLLLLQILYRNCISVKVLGSFPVVS